MRLVKVQPHRPDGKDGYEQHVYNCSECANISRFIFEVPSSQVTAVFGQVTQ